MRRTECQRRQQATTIRIDQSFVDSRRLDQQRSIGFNAIMQPSIDLENSWMAQFSHWLIDLVSSDAFVLMCVMFLIVGLFELIIPAHKIPSRHYRFNLAYAFVNIVAITAFTPLISAAIAYAIQTLGFGLIDLRALGFRERCRLTFCGTGRDRNFRFLSILAAPTRTRQQNSLATTSAAS